MRGSDDPGDSVVVDAVESLSVFEIERLDFGRTSSRKSLLQSFDTDGGPAAETFDTGHEKRGHAAAVTKNKADARQLTCHAVVDEAKNRACRVYRPFNPGTAHAVL